LLPPSTPEKQCGDRRGTSARTNDPAMYECPSFLPFKGCRDDR
jgi:hypothetical protein